jgi:hypothetical protein
VQQPGHPGAGLVQLLVRQRGVVHAYGHPPACLLVVSVRFLARLVTLLIDRRGPQEVVAPRYQAWPARWYNGTIVVPTYDAWTRVLRTVDPRFEFSDPPLRHSLQMALAFAVPADRVTAVLTGPSVIAGSRPALAWLPRPTATYDMVPVSLEDHPLTATAALVWHGDLPRPLQ